MNKGQKQKLILEAAKAASDARVNNILKEIGEETIYQFIISALNEELEYIDQEIRDEQNFAKENPPGSAYASAGLEAKKRVKYLKKAKKTHSEVSKLFDSFFKMKKKADSL
jgi:hypothetical protein